MSDEATLVARAARGDAQAFGDLFEQYARDVYRLACALGHRGADAEDLMQDTFLAAFEGLGRYESRSSFKTWLLAILFRQAHRRQRYQRIRVMESLDDAQAKGADGPHSSYSNNHEGRMDAEAMLETLSSEHRTVLVLRELEGLSYDEIAQTLDIPRGTVESRLFRARAILRERFSDYGSQNAAQSTKQKPVESRHE